MIGWWRRYRRRRDCWHHDPHTGESFIVGTLRDLGRSKFWTCTQCERVWFR